jgi:predicted flap endonuclease-1-like 5' DNA nuclease
MLYKKIQLGIIMAYKISEIEGIGPVYAEKLAAAGIDNTDQMLSKCGSAKGRTEVSGTSGVSTALLLKWADMADMMRISGVGRQFGELLKASGVDTIKELRTRRADNLAVKMAEVNAEKKLSKSVPNEKMIQAWIDAAKLMEPTISH